LRKKNEANPMSRGAFLRLSRTLLLLLLVFAASVPAAVAQADVKGQWSTLNYSMTINPIHVALMKNGKILVLSDIVLDADKNVVQTGLDPLLLEYGVQLGMDRVLYAMDQMGLQANRSFRKSAGVVGEVLKEYHPHGDASVYDTLVRLVQPWAMR
jgi:isopentenyl phosphate kinase